MSRKNRTLAFAIGIATIVAAVVAGVGLVSATASGDVRSQAATALLHGAEPGTRVAVFPQGEGHAADRAVFVTRLSNGFVCVLDAEPAGENAGGGCSPGENPLGGKPFTASFMFDGGPSVSSVSDARLSGLADASVSRLVAVMSDGSTRTLPLSAKGVADTDYRVFAFRVSSADLRHGVSPTAVVAYDRHGSELARQATGLPT